jgi:hypothetical protein
VLLLAILTPLYGIVGMMAALFVISPILINLIYAKVVKDKLSIRIQISKPLRVALAGIVLFIALYALAGLLNFRYLSLVAGVVAAVVLYPPLVAISGGLRKKDIKSLREVFGKRRIGMPFMKVLSYAALFAC